eukprot:29614-Pelagococcus_subviridis.AAC.1
MRPFTSLHCASTLSRHPRRSKAICPRPLTPTLYDRSGSPHAFASLPGGGGSRSHTSTFVHPRRASMIADARPVGPPPTITVLEGGAGCTRSRRSSAVRDDDDDDED